MEDNEFISLLVFRRGQFLPGWAAGQRILA